MKKSFYTIPLLLTSIYGAGGVPMMTNGTGTPHYEEWEVNIAYDATLNSDTKRYKLPIFDINYGLSENIQLKVESAFMHIHNDTFKDSGIGDAEVGVKWRFFEQNGLSFAVYPQYSFAPVKKNIKNDIASKESISLPLLVHKEFEKFGITGEVNYMTTNDEKSYLKTGLLFNYELNKKIELLAEIYRSAQFDSANETVSLNAGCTYAFYHNINGLFSLGREIKSLEQKSTLLYIGLQLLF